MTFPKVVRDLLILAPSFRRVPLAPVESALSDPAKSTSEILDTCKNLIINNTSLNYIMHIWFEIENVLFQNISLWLSRVFAVWKI